MCLFYYVFGAGQSQFVLTGFFLIYCILLIFLIDK